MKIRFKNVRHKEFYFAQASICGTWDVYHMALMYILGLSDDCIEHIEGIYNYKERLIIPECLEASWQTSGSRRLILLAYNLFNGYISEDPTESTPDMLFCDGNAPFFYEAIRLRYPEYTESTLYSVIDERGQVIQDGISEKLIADSYCAVFAKKYGGEYKAIKQAEIIAIT